MPMIGGTAHWIGPVIGALLLGTVQQIVTVTISSEINVLVVGVLLVALRGAGARTGSSACSAELRWLSSRSSRSRAFKRFGGFTALDRREPRHRARASASA